MFGDYPATEAAINRRFSEHKFMAKKGVASIIRYRSRST